MDILGIPKEVGDNRCRVCRTSKSLALKLRHLGRRLLQLPLDLMRLVARLSKMCFLQVRNQLEALKRLRL